jgi:predicted esterase
MFQAIPEIEELADQDEYTEAFKLALEAEKYIPGDQRIQELKNDVTGPIDILTDPPGADVYIKDYDNLEMDEWDYLCQSPGDKIRAPRGFKRWKITKPGYDDAYGATDINRSSFPLQAKLLKKGTTPPGMVLVRFVRYRQDEYEYYDYFIDKYEVTNKKFKEFVDRGGYQNKEFWKYEFTKDGRVLSWEEAMKEFVDKTGRPGPFTWEFGEYPEGQDDYPVCGVSWYEAAAYAEFAGKFLPSDAHWTSAFPELRTTGGSDIILLSNFQGNGVAPVGEFKGIAKFGAYDMAGNVKEWCWNTIDEDKKVIRGGAWNESQYMFGNMDMYPPTMRAENFGFRCIMPLPGEEIPAVSQVKLPARQPTDFREAKPCSDEEFEIYKGLYTYNKTELNPYIESTEELSRSTLLETVSIDADYENERIPIHVFLPRNSDPPYQTILYFLGDGAMFVDSIFEYGYEDAEIFNKVGRAVVVPTFKGLLERRYENLSWESEVSPAWWKDTMFMRYRDLARAIDYLETREDIITEKLAFMGVSGSAAHAVTLLGVESRLKAAILLSGGVWPLPSEVNPINFMPRIKIPIVMLNGLYDFGFPKETNQDAMYSLFGTPDEHKYHKTYETGHSLWDKREWVKDALTFLDKYFGPPQRLVEQRDTEK